MVSRSEERPPTSDGAPPWDLFFAERLLALLPTDKEATDKEPAGGVSRSLIDFDHASANRDPEKPFVGDLTPPRTDAPPKIDTTALGDPPAILCRLHPESTRGFSASALERLRGWLDAWHRQLPLGAYLLLAVPCDARPPAKGRGAKVPSRQPSALRQTILLLSEHGFAVRKELTLNTKAIGAWAVAHGSNALSESTDWQLICCRRDAFHIRPYEEGDEAAILELFPACFHVTRGDDHWRWKYRHNPFGDTAISLALSDGNELGAHYAGYAMPFYYHLGKEAKLFPALQMGDTMTNPSFRHAGGGRSGLLARTVRHFFALHRGGPYGFFYGFNTGPIQRFCRWFIGGSRVEPVGYWRYDSPAPGRAWTTAGYRVEPLVRASHDLDRLFRQAAPHYGFLVKRNARYLHWRYFSCPDTQYLVLGVRRWHRLVGWGAFRLHEDRLIWGDSFIHPRHRRSAGALLSAARAALGDGTEPVEAWFSSRPTWWTAQVRELGFERLPQPQGLGFMALPDGEPEATEHLPDLYYTMGDGDLF